MAALAHRRKTTLRTLTAAGHGVRGRPDDHHEHNGRRDRPGRGAGGMNHCGQRDRRDGRNRQPPVVADDEVIDPGPGRLQPGQHQTTSVATAALARFRIAVSPIETPAMTATSGRMARSLPGQCAPAPSAPQNVPNVVSMIPTPYFSVFSGTRDSGERSATPATTTTTTAAAAAIAASPILPWLVPKVSTMNATSSPSSSTPLNAIVVEYASSRPSARAISVAAALVRA